MRYFNIVVSLVSGILLLACTTMAAGIDTFAKVNLVQGVEARLESNNHGVQPLEASDDLLQLTLNGPKLYCVDVRLSLLAVDSPWSGLAGDSTLALDSNHDLNGNLDLDLPLDQNSDSPTRYILTVTYE